MGGKSSPSPPDYTQAAQQTAAGNLESARSATAANRPTQVTPYGTSSWYNTPGTDDWVQDIELDPDTQAALDSQQNVQRYMSDLGTKYMGKVEEGMDKPYTDLGPMEQQNLGDMPDLGFGAVQQIQDAMMGRLQPGLDKQRSAAQQRLASQGITMGSEADNDVQGQLNESDNSANREALLAAMGAYGSITGRQMQGRQEQMAEYGQRMQGRQQQLQEQAYQRSLPLSELNAILRGNQVQAPQFNSFANQGTTAGPDFSGAAESQYQAALGGSNASKAAGSGLGSAVGGLIGTMIMPGVGTAIGSGLGGYAGSM